MTNGYSQIPFRFKDLIVKNVKNVENVDDLLLFIVVQNYVITGVTCSSSDGYLPSLQSRQLIKNNLTRTHYQCRCVKIGGTAAGEALNERAECGIHYWQCPTTVG